jgi:hypothetical protein
MKLQPLPLLPFTNTQLARSVSIPNPFTVPPMDLESHPISLHPVSLSEATGPSFSSSAAMRGAMIGLLRSWELKEREKQALLKQANPITQPTGQGTTPSSLNLIPNTPSPASGENTVVVNPTNTTNNFTLKPASNDVTFGMSIVGFVTKVLADPIGGALGNAAISDVWSRLTGAIVEDVQKSPELRELRKHDHDFGTGMDHVDLAAKTNDPKRQKEHLTKAQQLFNKVANKEQHPTIERLNSAAYSMEMARRLQHPPGEVEFHADKTENLLTQAQNELPSPWLALKWLFGQADQDLKRRETLFEDMKDHLLDVRTSYLPDDKALTLKQKRQAEKLEKAEKRREEQERRAEEAERMESIREDRVDHWYNDID